MKALKMASVALLAGIAIFSSYKYFSSIKEKYELIEAKNRADAQALMIENERIRLLKTLEEGQLRQKSLTAENTALQGQLKSAQDTLQKTQSELQTTQKTLTELNNEFSLAKAENAALVKQFSEVKAESDALAQEKDMLRQKLSSLSELKQAIRELRQKLGNARREIDTRLQKDQIIIGNGGYMLRDGKPTFPARIKIEVVPLPEQPIQHP
jgi:chromosome segregation ATPase